MPKQRSGGPKNVPPNKKYRDCFFLFSICASLQKRGAVKQKHLKNA
jgi:hypothetical protein